MEKNWRNQFPIVTCDFFVIYNEGAIASKIGICEIGFPVQQLTLLGFTAGSVSTVCCISVMPVSYFQLCVRYRFNNESAVKGCIAGDIPNMRLVPHFRFYNKYQFSYESVVVTCVEQIGQSTRLVPRYEM